MAACEHHPASTLAFSSRALRLAFPRSQCALHQESPPMRPMMPAAWRPQRPRPSRRCRAWEPTASLEPPGWTSVDLGRSAFLPASHLASRHQAWLQSRRNGSCFCRNNPVHRMPCQSRSSSLTRPWTAWACSMSLVLRTPRCSPRRSACSARLEATEVQLEVTDMTSCRTCAQTRAGWTIDEVPELRYLSSVPICSGHLGCLGAPLCRAVSGGRVRELLQRQLSADRHLP
mmetsp:Transcript_853/g.2349  ORF Transcript_853/g.2349 Transcript_853/m.2349 type:complete len:230 (+) Transcript_853:551-1240(+)